MSYTPNEWDVGDVITAAKLNALEQAVAEASQGGTGGYDGIVHYYHDNNSSNDPEITIVSGDYNSLMTMIGDNTPPNVLVKFWDDITFQKWSSSAIAVYSYDANYICFSVKQPTNNQGSSDQIIGRSFNWNNDDTITWTY